MEINRFQEIQTKFLARLSNYAEFTFDHFVKLHQLLLLCFRSNTLKVIITLTRKTFNQNNYSLLYLFNILSVSGISRWK